MTAASRAVVAVIESNSSKQSKDLSVRTLLAGAAQYICLAHALQPSKDIYRKSLAVVRQMLPLPFLRAGYLTAPRARSIGTVTETYRRDWFVLDQRSLRQASNMETSLSTAGAGEVHLQDTECELWLVEKCNVQVLLHTSSRPNRPSRNMLLQQALWAAIPNWQLVGCSRGHQRHGLWLAGFRVCDPLGERVRCGSGSDSPASNAVTLRRLLCRVWSRHLIKSATRCSRPCFCCCQCC